MDRGPDTDVTPIHVLAVRDVGSRTDPGDTAGVRVIFDRNSGSAVLEQRVLRFAEGRSQPRGPGELEEALFVLEGEGTLQLDGDPHALEPETAVQIAPGETYAVENPGPADLELLSVLAPPERPAGGERSVTVRLADQESRDATSDREFRILLEPSSGLTGGTLFVGYIPLKRAPEHYHLYDEVIYVLDGEGVLHIGDEHTPIARSSCIHLSPELRHILENTGPGEMRVVALFRPAGDPSEAYLPDGSRAYVDTKGDT